MIIFPAIDLKDKQAVRLTKGDYAQVKVYGQDPAAVAADFIARGATHLHIVDLDGAKDGTLSNFEAVQSIVAAGDLFTEVGGGIRNEERIRKYLSLGVDRVILGTAALQNFPFLEEMVKKYGPQIAVGVDAKEGKVAVNGWLDTSEQDAVEFCRRLESIGVDTVIFTDISKDGMLSGTNLAVYEELSKFKTLKIVASGGISYYDEIEKLQAMGIHAAIVGKAIYEGKLQLEQVLSLAKGGADR